MPKYRVVVTIEETYEVEAESAEDAERLEIEGEAGDPVSVEVQDRDAREVEG